MQPRFKRHALAAALLSAAGLMAACGGSSATPDAEDTALKFDASAYTTVNVTVDGAALKVRQYRVVYVAKPVKMALTQQTLMGTATTIADPYVYQTMVVSVPEAQASDQKAALYVAVNNGGWFASAVSTTITGLL